MLQKTIQILAVITVVMCQTYLAPFTLTSKKSYLFIYLMLPLSTPSLFLYVPCSSTLTSPILIGMGLRWGGGKSYFTTQNRSTSLLWIKWTFWTLEVPYISNQANQKHQKSNTPFFTYCDWKSSLGRWQEWTQVQSQNATFTPLKCSQHEPLYKPEAIFIFSSPLMKSIISF